MGESMFQSYISNINLPMHKVYICGIFQKKHNVERNTEQTLELNVINKVYHLVIKIHLC